MLVLQPGIAVLSVCLEINHGLHHDGLARLSDGEIQRNDE